MCALSLMCLTILSYVCHSPSTVKWFSTQHQLYWWFQKGTHVYNYMSCVPRPFRLCVITHSTFTLVSTTQTCIITLMWHMTLLYPAHSTSRVWVFQKGMHTCIITLSTVCYTAVSYVCQGHEYYVIRHDQYFVYEYFEKVCTRAL